jgi:hypothetical protein
MSNPSQLDINRNHLISLPIEDTKENYLNGFWQWVGFLAQQDYIRGVEAVFWPKPVVSPPAQLKERVTKFWGGSKPWSVVVPNARLIRVVNDDARFEPPAPNGAGWFMAQIPVTTEPLRSKADDIILQGVAVSFFVREFERRYVLHFEIFHA